MTARLVLALTLLGAAPAWAQSISVAGGPQYVGINTAVAGSQPSDGQATSSYSVSGACCSTRRITARLQTPLPAGYALSVTLAPFGGATSAGAVTLSGAEQNVVTNIPWWSSGSGSITYRVTGGNVTKPLLPPGSYNVEFKIY